MPDWTNPIGKGAKPSRIDMGVDYTGSFPLYALGSGTITNVYNSGWPGGKFIGLTAGGSDTYLKNNDQIAFTQSALVLENLIGQLVANFSNLFTSEPFLFLCCAWN